MSAAEKWSLWISSCGGLGLVPRGPATIGAMVGAALWCLLEPSLVTGVFLILGVTAVGIMCTRIVIRLTGDKDPQLVIIDEVAGVMVALYGLPATPLMGLVAVVVFRVFDKKKFGPARILDERGDAVGVMLDDVMAGLYANVVLRIGMEVFDHVA